MDGGWGSPSLSASPPPPPRPPCTRCTTCHPYTVGGIDDRGDEESTGGALRERELRLLHRSVPALRRADVDTRAIRHHFYPEGGWGWIVCGAAFLAHVLTTGLQLAYGALHVYALRHLGERPAEHAVWAGALCVGVSRATGALLVGARRRSPRLAAFAGGLLLPLACLFTSFATQLHQIMLSYGVVLGIACGLVREAGGLVMGAYFRRRRKFVELVAQAGGGVGIALFSVSYKEAVGKLGWRLGLQAVTGVLLLAFLLSAAYRSASLYHPQRRAILHLKNQRKKVKEKKCITRAARPPMFDLQPLRSRPARLLLLAAATAAFGIYTPVFYLALQGYREGLEDSALVLLQTFLGFAAALGCAGFGALIVRPSAQCLVSRQYLCQTAMLGIAVSLLALSSVRGYHGYVLFAWLYGLCLGGFLYSIKMLTMERIRARHFTKVWGYVQGAEAIPAILGVPVTGYINQHCARAGYYFSFAATVAGAILLFFVGFSKREPANSGVAPTITNGDCICPAISPHHPPPPRYNTINQNYPNVNYCQYYPNYGYQSGYCNNQNQNPYFFNNGVQKSLSFATPLDYFCEPNSYSCIEDDRCACSCSRGRPTRSYCSRPQHSGLRPSASVPEGLARARRDSAWSVVRSGSCRSFCRRPIIRNVQVIEQMTTSV